MARFRPYVLGLLGLAIITFPFLWLRLVPDFDKSTMGVAWAPEHGWQFFSDLSTVFIVAFLIWAGNRLNRRFGWSGALAKLRMAETAGRLWTRYWAWLAVVLLALLVPMSVRPTGSYSGMLGLPWISTSTLGLFTAAGLYMLLAVGLNITVGMTGLLVLGYAGFYALGAYAFALAQQNLPWFPWWVAAPLAFIVGGGAGYLLGLPCLRLRGDYLAIVTLGFAEAFRELIRNLSYDPDDGTPHSAWVTELLKIFNTGGDKGIVLHEGSVIQGFAGLSRQQVSFAVTALVLVAGVFLVQRLYHSPVGRAWIAIRENEVAAESMGVPVVRMKLFAFSLSAAIAAVAGVIYAAKNAYVSPAMCEFQESIIVLAMVILGGLGNSYGALLGAALLNLTPEYLKQLSSMIQSQSSTFQTGPGAHANSSWVPSFVTDSLEHLSDYRLLLFGAVMVIMMLYRPQGLLGGSRRKTEMLHK